MSIVKQWSLEPSVSVNSVHLPAGDFTTTLLRARTDYGFSPRMFASALFQYSSTDKVFSSNLRFRWEYQPGGELFVVYTDERDTLMPGYPALKNRAFVIKVAVQVLRLRQQLGPLEITLRTATSIEGGRLSLRSSHRQW